jgi:L-lactate utilization protein LutB
MFFRNKTDAAVVAVANLREEIQILRDQVTALKRSVFPDLDDVHPAIMHELRNSGGECFFSQNQLNKCAVAALKKNGYLVTYSNTVYYVKRTFSCST